MSTSDASGWNSIDQFEEAFPIYNCAFLDILGYKQKAVDYFEQRFNLYERINRALTATTTAQNLTAPLIATSGLTIEIISDSIIMLQPVQTAGLGTIMLFASHFASVLSFEGLFIRGGISQGRHCRRKNPQGFDFLASEALQKAYKLESEKAVYPRVILDSDLVGGLLPEERKIIIRENNDYIVHFSNFIINREGTNHKDVLSEMTELQTAMNQQSDEKVKLKFLWLLDYYYWTISTNPNWDASAFRTFHSGMTRGFAEFK